MCTARKSERVRAREDISGGRAAGASMMGKAKGRTYPIQKGRRDHAAPDNWRRRVGNVDHHQRVGIPSRHVSVRAAHRDGYSLCAPDVRASELVRARQGISSGRTASMMDGADASATRQSSSITVAAPRRTHLSKKGRRDHAATDDRRHRVANVDHHQRVGILSRHVSVRAAHGDFSRLCVQHVRASA